MLVLAHPLIAIITIDHSPDRFHRQRFHQFQIIPECFQPDSTPNIMVGIFVAIQAEKL